MNSGKIGGIWLKDALAGLQALGSGDEGVAVGEMGIVTGATDPGLYRCTAVLSGSSTWDGPLGGAGGGGGTGMDPGYFDSTGSVFCNHFDDETAGTWTSAVGNNLTVLSGSVNTPICVSDATRPITTFAKGALESGAWPGIVNLGDATWLAAIKQVSSSGGSTQTIFSVGDTAVSAPADNVSTALRFSSGDVQAFWEHSFGTDIGVTWNSTSGPNLSSFSAGWHVVGMRRDTTAKTVELFFDHFSSGAISYTTNPTDGADGHLAIGGRSTATEWCEGIALAGLVGFASVISDSAYHAQVDRIKRGTAK